MEGSLGLALRVRALAGASQQGKTLPHMTRISTGTKAPREVDVGSKACSAERTASPSTISKTPIDAGDFTSSAKETQPQDAIRLRATRNLERVVQGFGTQKQNVSLHDYQHGVFEDLLAFFRKGLPRGYLQLPTGYGKTVVFSTLVQVTELKTLILVPRLNLIEQTKEEMERFAKGTPVSTFYGRSKENLGNQVVIATYQSLEALNKKAAEQGTSFPLIVCDEAHRSLSPRIQEILNKLGEENVTLGLTATLDFSEKKTVQSHYHNSIHSMGMVEAISRNILSGARCIFVTSDIDIGSVKTTASDFDSVELEKALDVEKRNLAALKVFQIPEFAGKTAVAFCLSVAHAIKLAQMANNCGISAAAVYGEMAPKERERIIDDHNKVR